MKGVEFAGLVRQQWIWKDIVAALKEYDLIPVAA